MPEADYRRTLNMVRQKLSELDPELVAAKRGVVCLREQRAVKGKFINRPFTVAWPECQIESEGGAFDLSEEILLIHYLLAPQYAPVQGQWITFKELPGGMVYNPAFTKRAITPLIKDFGNNPAKFKLAAALLEAQELNQGDQGIIVNALPLVPVGLVLWFGDEEFPPNANILFDASASQQLPTEDYAVLASLIVKQLARAVQN